MADLKIIRKYSKTLKRSRRILAYDFMSEENGTLLGLVGPGVPVCAVSLADFLYEGEWNQEFRKQISLLPQEHPAYAVACRLAAMDINRFKIELYKFLIHTMLLLVYDEAEARYALLGDQVWIYDLTQNPTWKNQIWEGFFITKKGDRQDMPQVLEKIAPERLSLSNISVDVPGLSMREMWEELDAPALWWQPVQPAPHLAEAATFKGRVKLSVAEDCSYYQPVVLAQITCGEDITLRVRKTELHFGPELTGLRVWANFANRDEAEAACEAFNIAEEEQIEGEQIEGEQTIYWGMADPARLKDGLLEIILELPYSLAPGTPLRLQGKVAATKTPARP